ncbi:tyrosine-type recombinase/integrase [Aeromonas hydrophila]|uniref:tyrosine-type recombinase/integrase n=1 Tax=Aeromonas hydrophila TaxID=644 RepID=UPI003F83752C
MDRRLLPAFYKEYLANSARFDVSHALLSFVILTACRSGEARNIRWEELGLNAAIWTIPADRMKTQVTHRIPLSRQAITVLEKVQGLHNEWVFPSPRKQVPLTDMAMTSPLRHLDAKSTTPGRIATAHGFRSSFRDWCSEQGYARDLAE